MISATRCSGTAAKSAYVAGFIAAFFIVPASNFSLLSIHFSTKKLTNIFRERPTSLYRHRGTINTIPSLRPPRISEINWLAQIEAGGSSLAMVQMGLNKFIEGKLFKSHHNSLYELLRLSFT
ncbi:MAG: hypothetical protein Q8O63_01865 [Hoeflea sp.]|nr:hypothetical protein [Hoeflea sp.]